MRYSRRIHPAKCSNNKVVKVKRLSLVITKQSPRLYAQIKGNRTIKTSKTRFFLKKSYFLDVVRKPRIKLNAKIGRKKQS